MYGIVGFFVIALVLSLLLTPLARRFGLSFGFTDEPDWRKVHKGVLPRSGGIAVFVATLSALFLGNMLPLRMGVSVFKDKQSLFFIAGATLVFLVGVLDDRFRLGAKTKLLIQIMAATVAYFGGLRIEFFALQGILRLDFNFFSYLLTVFWFVFIINAVNLIDGLDGLAAGVVFFVSVVVVLLSASREEYLMAFYFAALAGAVLGFLRYNFNPASIILGDGGSYFLGYAVAALSVMGSVKSQVGAAFLIPIIALGVPIFDTIISPIRRFVFGRKMFEPDRGHVHHQLLKKGWSQKKAVFVLYGVTVLLGLIALAMVHLRDERAGLFLIFLGLGAFFFIRKLGYFSYFALDKVYGWVRDVSDEAGLSRDRRSFLSLQVEISESSSLEELWANVGAALDKLNFDMAEMRVFGSGGEKNAVCAENPQIAGLVPVSHAAPESGNFVWTAEGFDRHKDLCLNTLFKVELPLLDDGGKFMGTLWLVKDVNKDPISHYTLRRVEHLRRGVTEKLSALGKNAGGGAR